MEMYPKNSYYNVDVNDEEPGVVTGFASNTYGHDAQTRHDGHVRFDTLRDAYGARPSDTAAVAVSTSNDRKASDPTIGTGEVIHFGSAVEPSCSSNCGDVAVSLDNGVDREYRWKNVVWVKDTLIFPSRNGLERTGVCKVQYRRKNSSMTYELYTYAEGMRRNRGPVERDFKYLCGEILSSEPLSSVGKLKHVFTCVDAEDVNGTTSNRAKTSASSGPDVDGNKRPLRLRTVPLEVDNSNMVLVFRTYNDTLALQLLPTVYTRLPLTPGQPLFTHTNPNVVGAVGNKYSEFSYVINGAPNSYALFKVPPPSGAGGDRAYVVLVDRRRYVDTKSSRQDDAGYAVPAYVKRVVEIAYNGVSGGGVSREGANALGDDSGYDDYGKKRSTYKFDEDDLLYLGVVNSALQVTDVLANTKKDKSPKNAVVIFIDRVGVTAVSVDGLVPKLYWAHKEDSVVYSVASRDFWHRGKDEIIVVNTESKLRRFKSQEILI